MKTTIQLNEITEIRITRSPTEAGMWEVAMTKEFAPENGGGAQTFTELAGGTHHALDVARGMITLSPGRRTDLGSPLDQAAYSCGDRASGSGPLPAYCPEHPEATRLPNVETI